MATMASVHDGLLAASLDQDKARLITGGEDGKVCSSAGETADLLAEAGKKWITSVAAGPQGAVAYATGKTAFVRFADGKTKDFAHPRSVEGIAFAPKGMRIGVARYNGATLHFPATAASRSNSNGRARTPASPSRPTAISSSPPCRKTRCMAGSSPTASTCA